MKSTNVGETAKVLKGDGQRIEMDLNDIKLKVLGDGCRVTVAKNRGSIRVVGDGCWLKVNCNDGDIEYKGDGGSVYLGGGSRTDSVNYVGDGGRINVGEKKSRSRGKKRSEKGCLSDSELEINVNKASNESKEAKEVKKTFVVNQQRAKKFGGERTDLRRSKTTTVTKLSSEEGPVVVTANNLINHWFGRNPPSVIRTFKSDPESR